MKVLHLFPEYLPLTMIWAFQQIRHIPDVETHMAGLSYLPDSYHDPAFRYWPNPKYRFPKALQNGVHIILRKTRGYDRFLAAYIRREGIDILHAHFGHIGADYSGLGKRLGIPVVVSFYGFDYGRILSEKPRYRKAYLRMFRQAGAVTGEGPYAVGQLEALGCPPSQIRQIPLGVGTSVIPVFLRKKETGRLRLVQVATLTPRKGHLLGLDALEKALESGMDITLDCYGPVEDAELASKIQRRIAAGTLAGKVRLLESVPYSRLHALLERYDVFFQPSVFTPGGDCEGGAPIALLDAQATGMPVVATRHCDIPFEVEHGQTGLLGAENDAAELAAHLAAFARMDQQAFDAFGTRARNKIETAFQVEHGASLLAGLYRELLNR